MSRRIRNFLIGVKSGFVLFFQGETFLPLDGECFDPFEEHGKLRGTDQNDRITVAGECHRKPKSTCLKPLVPQSVTVAVPIKDFESVSTPIDEDEKGTVKWILFETIFDDGGKTVE